jgi:phosphohistidine phosphatase
LKIYLVRHGAAEHPAMNPERPLSDTGRREIESVAEALRERGVAPVWIAHSPKTRAIETATILGEALAPDVLREERGDLMPNGPVDGVAIELGIRDGDGMLVGHMPFVGDLASALLGSKLSDFPQFPTGGVMGVERGVDGAWEMLWMLAP